MLRFLLRPDGRTEARILSFSVLPRKAPRREESATSILDFLVYFQKLLASLPGTQLQHVSFCQSSFTVFEMVCIFVCLFFKSRNGGLD